MPQEYLVIFLLFLAVLAFAWFYLQRAKARDGATQVEASSATAAAAPPQPVAPEVSPAATDDVSPSRES